ncbi:hypothetical protein OPT61_g5685 [Boeremia exigua]|uniref:Uncharacterized protein n=1 Tax=Boeremia exigua TaxID=749465 RepID=A0ACC2I9J0_9PLEO|nr:hypothetical protein OPT61_g5685 [Boeremia exigua]
MASYGKYAFEENSDDATDLSQANKNHQLSVSVSSLDSRHGKSLPLSKSARGVGILVMGLTGAGKSTFISQITQQDIGIGHSLGSCTAAVHGYRYLDTNGQEIWLIDTPGFDDTNKANAQLLGEIAWFLCTFCSEHELIIGGVLYVHRITDIRMSNSSIKSLRIFEALCGEACFRDVMIVTTMWDLLRTPDALQSAERREATLQSRDNFFGHLMKSGARYARHKDTRSSSIDIVENLVNRQSNVILALQRELERGSATTLVDTTVGKYLEGDLRDMRKRYETKIAQLEAYNNALVGEDDDMTAAVEPEKAQILHIESGINLLYLTFEGLRTEYGTKMIEGGGVTTNEETKATLVNHQVADLAIKDWTITAKQDTSAPQEAIEAGTSTRSPFAQNHIEGLPREESLKDKPKKDTAWSDFLRAIIGQSNDHKRAMYFESRRSSSLPLEPDENRISRANRPKKPAQHRERRAQSKAVEAQHHPAHVALYDGQEATVPDLAEQTDITTLGCYQRMGYENLPQPERSLFNEVRSLSPEPVTTPSRLPVTITFETSGLTRTYPNSPVTSSSPPLRRSTLSYGEQIRDIYSRSNFLS